MDTFAIGGGLEVHRLGFGAMRITGEGIWGPPDDPEEAKRLLRRVVELGLDLIDTADSYGPEVSEKLIAEVLHPYPDDLVIATKGGLRRTGPGQWPRDARPERLKECCEGSLRRLRLERIDLYQLHAPDPKLPYEDSIDALKELQNEGKIRHVGVSNVSVEQLEQARGIVDVVSVQNRYNLTERHSGDVLDRAPGAERGRDPDRALAVGGGGDWKRFRGGNGRAMTPTFAPTSLDHVALWVEDRDPLAAFLCDHLGMHVIEETDTFTLVGIDAKLGKLTLFDAEGPRQRGALERVVLRVAELEPALATLPFETTRRADGVAAFEAPPGVPLRLVAADGEDFDLDHVVLGLVDPEPAARVLSTMGFERRADGCVAVGDRYIRIVRG